MKPITSSPSFWLRLYKNFRKRTEENEKLARTSYERHPYSEKARNKFIAKFKTTQEHLYHLLGYIKYTDGKDLLEYVDALSASVNLKEDINELVDIYMNYMEQKDTVLILRVDDVDINERHAGEMVETMRKYFIQPNILVLISFKAQSTGGYQVFGTLRLLQARQADLHSRQTS